MTEEDRTLEQDDLDAQNGQPLPDREVMSTITPDPTPFPGEFETEPESGKPDNVREPLKGGEQRMTNEGGNVSDETQDQQSQSPQEWRTLSKEELDELAGEELPERAAMSLIDANIAAPINAAVALNVASDNSVAYANAEQDVDITQHN